MFAFSIERPRPEWLSPHIKVWICSNLIEKIIANYLVASGCLKYNGIVIDCYVWAR